MWNHFGHLEAYFGVPSVGGVLHTLNLRLHPDELAYIVNHAQDRFLIVDDVLLDLYEKFKNKVKFERVIVVPFGGCSLSAGYDNYETLLREKHNSPVYPDLDENDAAAMCYTSGTTGKPKGVAYSHRAIALHSYSISLPDNFSLSRFGLHPARHVHVSCQCVGPASCRRHEWQQAGIAGTEPAARETAGSSNFGTG
jgi:fatty-acyl-CoA synthase